MNRLIMLALVFASAMSCFAGTQVQVVGTTAIPVLAPRGLKGAQGNWNYPVAAGELRRYTDGTTWMFLGAVGGTGAIAAPQPAWFSGVNYLRVKRYPRAFATLQNTGTVPVWLAFGNEKPVVGAGLRLDVGAIVSLEKYDGAVWGIVASGSGTVAVADVDK